MYELMDSINIGIQFIVPILFWIFMAIYRIGSKLRDINYTLKDIKFLLEEENNKCNTKR